MLATGQMSSAGIKLTQLLPRRVVRSVPWGLPDPCDGTDGPLVRQARCSLLGYREIDAKSDGPRAG